MRPEAKTRKGTFVGTQEENGVMAFRGIPFAQPPVGELRWREPLELPDSEERYDAGEDRAIPVQSEDDPRYAGLPKSEDCLYLNIFTADLEKKGKPVLVWAYGGAYIMGGISYSGYHGGLLVRENPDILVVTVNYRLGVFGTLNLSKLDPAGTYQYSNNLARLDLQASLKWVHENIAAFGGDPENVTIWGHSAGSSNISAQLMMADSRPYFQKAIMHSSFAVDIGTTSWENSLGAADVFFEFLGNPTLEELLKIPAEEIYAAQVKLQRSDFFDSERKPFSVVLDDIVVPKDGFEQLTKGAAAGIDVIVGTSCGEYDQQFRPMDLAEKYQFLRSQLGKKLGDLDALIRFYQGQSPDKPLEEVYMDIKNDVWLRVPGNLLAQAVCASGGSRAWMYYTELRRADGTRAHHGIEFETIFCREDRTLLAQETAYQVRQTFLNFVRHGAPQGGGLPVWPEYDGANRRTMIFSKEPRIAEGIRRSEMDRVLPLFVEYKCL